ncbi:unnamed protein product, partial [Scytosiphon promiscuus]
MFHRCSLADGVYTLFLPFYQDDRCTCRRSLLCEVRFSLTRCRKFRCVLCTCTPSCECPERVLLFTRGIPRLIYPFSLRVMCWHPIFSAVSPGVAQEGGQHDSFVFSSTCGACLHFRHEIGFSFPSPSSTMKP